MSLEVHTLELLPGVVTVAGPLADLARPLAASEQAAVGLAGQQRYAEFAAGRGAAHRALQGLGVQAEALPRSSQGAPSWPPALTGSIAHCAGYAAAAVAWQRDCCAIGVDVEPDLPLPLDAASLVITAEDQPLPEAQSRALFCAKECVHKSLNPLNDAWLEFDEVAVRFEDGERFSVQPLSAAAVKAMQGLRQQGRIARVDGYLLALLAWAPAGK